jgi:acetylglutamate kinase
MGGKTIGISGIDGGLLEAHIANPDLGYVGEIVKVNAEPLRALMDGGYMPMMAPLAMHRHDGSEHSGGALNINGDTVAGEVAHALGAERLVFLTDVAGIMDGNGRVIPRLDRRRANLLFRSGVVQGGMIPKLEACLRALEQTPVADIIDGRQPGALLECVKGGVSGTRIIA